MVPSIQWFYMQFQLSHNLVFVTLIAQFITMVTVVTQAAVPSPTVPTKGWERSHRKSFSIKEKREYVHAVDILVAKNISRCKACSILGLHPINYNRLKKVIAKVDALENSAGFVPHNTNGTARWFHLGCPSLSSVIKDNLSHFIFEKRQRRIQVSTGMFCQEACRLLPSFKNKRMEAKKGCHVIHQATWIYPPCCNTHRTNGLSWYPRGIKSFHHDDEGKNYGQRSIAHH